MLPPTEPIHSFYKTEALFTKGTWLLIAFVFLDHQMSATSEASLKSKNIKIETSASATFGVAASASVSGNYSKTEGTAIKDSANNKKTQTQLTPSNVKITFSSSDGNPVDCAKWSSDIINSKSYSVVRFITNVYFDFHLFFRWSLTLHVTLT